MKVEINNTKYEGLAGFIIGVPFAILTFLFTAVIFLFVSLVLLSPFILIGLIVWGIAS